MGEVSESTFTPRMVQVLALASQGQTDKEIAASLNLSKHTINFYWRNIFKVLQVNSRTEAVAKYNQQGSCVKCTPVSWPMPTIR